MSEDANIENMVKTLLEKCLAEIEEARLMREKYIQDSAKSNEIEIKSFPKFELKIIVADSLELMQLAVNLAKIYPNPNLKISQQQFKIPKQNLEEEK